jgi:hypothetical protein
MPEQTITKEQVKDALEREMRVHNDLVQARRDLARLLRDAKEQGVFVSSGCECDCPSIHVGVD